MTSERPTNGEYRNHVRQCNWAGIMACGSPNSSSAKNSPSVNFPVRWYLLLRQMRGFRWSADMFSWCSLTTIVGMLAKWYYPAVVVTDTYFGDLFNRYGFEVKNNLSFNVVPLAVVWKSLKYYSTDSFDSRNLRILKFTCSPNPFTNTCFVGFESAGTETPLS